MKHNSQILLFFIVLFLAHTICAADWPCYKADARRSSVSEESLSFPLYPHWVFKSAQRPQPAWPEPGRLMNTLDFDTAFQPVAAEGMVYFGSSADDSVYALDEQSGKIRWIFTTDGPVRFAPHIARGKCYFAGDDGYAYCLDALTGKLVWKFRVAGDTRKMAGNARIISRTPCRSGVLVVDDVVYVTAGMWPSEGVYMYALDADTGAVRWCNDTTHAMYVRYPHAPAVAFGNLAPQGYLLCANDILLVANGKSLPRGFDVNTGELLYYKEGNIPGYDHNGGHWITIAGDIFFNTAPAWQPDQQPRVGEGQPLWGDGLGGYNLATGARQWKHNKSYREKYNKLKRVRGEASQGLIGSHRLVYAGDMIYAGGRGEIRALDCSDDTEVTMLWTAEHPGRIYCMALAGNTLLIGGPGRLTGYSVSDGTVVWKQRCKGSVRGLAIANGRVVASTDRGLLYSFGAAKIAKPQVISTVSGDTVRVRSLPSGLLKKITKIIPDLPDMKGYALVAGEPDARLAEDVARQTGMKVVCILDSQTKADTERKRLIRESASYGSGVVVYGPCTTNVLPYADFIASLILVSGRSLGTDRLLAGGVPLTEAYRVLRPCGGVLLFINMQPDAMTACIKATGIPLAEVYSQGPVRYVRRGKLPGAFDWNSDAKADMRLKWPLELLWFGGPGGQTTVNRHQPLATIMAANGVFYCLGPKHVTAVDAYSGSELWHRQIDGVLRERKAVADDNNLYLELWGRYGAFDARTGKLTALYGSPLLSSELLVDSPKTFKIDTDKEYGGSVTVNSTTKGLQLELTTYAPVAAGLTNKIFPRDAWELSFDFRPADQRLYPEGPGAFEAVVFPEDGVWDAGLGAPHDQISIKKLPAEEGTTKVLLTIAWEKVKELTGRMPSDFTCAARLNLYDREKDPWRVRVRALPFSNGTDLLRDGTADFMLTSKEKQPAAGTVPVYALDELPEIARQPARMPPVSLGRDSDHSGRDNGPYPNRLDGYVLADRTQPLTGESGLLRYTRSYGCNATISSAQIDFFRSGTIGIYDRLDDSGMRNFSGIKSGCGVCTIASQGLYINAEGAADCSCGYNFATCFALAPAEKRKQEDWAIFDDKDMKSALTRTAALNFGAPGDRRDENGMLWLHYPRQPLARDYTIDLPCHLELFNDADTWYVNADRITLTNSVLPWVHASGYAGIKKMMVDLLYYEPGRTCLALDVKKAPAIDGRLDDPAWNGVGQTEIVESRDGLDRTSRVFLRRDKHNLYVAYEKPAVIDRRGKAEPWKVGPEEDDAGIWNYDHCDLILKNKNDTALAHFGAAAGNGRYDALWNYRVDIPRLQSIGIDGKADDWDGRGFTFALAEERGTCRLGWTRNGLVLLTHLPNDFFSYDPSWSAVHTLVANPKRTKLCESVIDAKTWKIDKSTFSVKETLTARSDWRLFKKFEPASFKTAKVTGDAGITVETLIPWSELGITPAIGTELGCQFTAFNPSHHDGNINSGAAARKDMLVNPERILRLRLARDASPLPKEKPIVRRQWYGSVFTYRMDEDSRWNGDWRSAWSASNDTLCIEMAIPWKTLHDAGISSDALLIGVQRSRMKDIPEAVFRKFNRNAYAVQTGELESEPRKYTVRMHFAELDDITPGERVFDIVLQDTVVARNVDIVTEAGGARTALIKEFPGISADKLISIEFKPKTTELTPRSMPAISGIEILRED